MITGEKTVAPAQTAIAEKDRWIHKTHNNINTYIYLTPLKEILQKELIGGNAVK